MAENNEGNVLAIAVTLAVVCGVAVGIRFSIRISKQLGLQIDDWLCLPALIFTTICCSLVAAGSAYSGSIEHRLDDPDMLTHPTMVQLQKFSLAFLAFQPLALGCTKASILFFYRRIFCGKAFNYAWWSLIALVGLWIPGFTLASLLQCGGNISDFWTTSSGNMKCHALSTSGAFITTDALLDMIIIALPIPFVLRLQMPLRSRVFACMIFLVGGASIPVAFARLGYFAHVQQDTPALLSEVWGVTMFGTTGFHSIALFCPTIELGVALIAACWPSISMAYAGGSRASPDNSPETAWQQLVEKYAHKEEGEIALAPVHTWPQMVRPNALHRQKESEDGKEAILSLKEIL